MTNIDQPRVASKSAVVGNPFVILGPLDRLPTLITNDSVARSERYFRIAIQGPSSCWQWKSTMLKFRLDTVVQWFLWYHAFSHDRLRVFFGLSREALDEQLQRENQGDISTSLIASEFLRQKKISFSREMGMMG